MCQAENSKTKLLKNFGNNIRSIRNKQKLSQEELALRIDSARNFIGCIERAEKAPTIITISRIAKALNVNIADIVKDIDV